MIIPTEKYLIIGHNHELDPFFVAAQEQGCFEFIDPSRSKEVLSEEALSLHRALKILQDHKYDASPKKSAAKVSPQKAAATICQAHADYLTLLEEKKQLEMEVERIKVFGDFDQDAVAFIEKSTHRFLQFYSLKSSKRETNPPKGLIYVGTEGSLDYFVAFHKEKTAYPGYIEMKIEQPLGLVLCDVKDTSQKIAENERILREYGCYFAPMQEALREKLNEDRLNNAKNFTKNLKKQLPSDAPFDQLFSIEAYVPKNKVSTLQNLLKGRSLYAEKVDLDPDEALPTYMENSGLGKVGEDLVHLYDTPALEDPDPSTWVFWSFAFFYAVIVADAGYGFIYFLLALYLQRRFPDWKGLKKRVKTLLFTISIFAMGWGVLTGSYFGIDLHPDNPLRKISLTQYLSEKKAAYHMQANDPVYQDWVRQYPAAKQAKTGGEFLRSVKNTVGGKTVFKAFNEFSSSILIELSLVIGVLHLLASFFRSWKANPSGLGWAFATLGGYLYFPKFLYAASLVNFLLLVPLEGGRFLGQVLLYSGIAFALIAALIQHRAKGIFEIANAIQVFADVLSYLRLYALGLAGMILADTFNQMGMEFGPFIGFFIILIGHGVNISLGIQGGIIHGLRLNFLEWYHYSFTGGGKNFNPLRLLEK
ncbi:MAG: V-type ATP synthase subunit I [Chlamydiota bacterium]